jgi:hypothetical protein
MTKEREILELKIGWDLSPYSQEEIVEALNSKDPIEVLLKYYREKEAQGKIL